ncbi:MAG TPA: hypothetical protein VIP80_02305 [Gemmatimonadales bacterium]|jgi:hypothetical protein
MDDRELERRLAELKETWRNPQDPPLDRIWQAVEERAFPARERRIPPRWIRTLLPLAAMLVLGFGLGQISPALVKQSSVAPPRMAGVSSSAGSAESAGPALNDQGPFVGVAADYLERVTALLVTLADANRRSGPAIEYSTAQARDLLVTTRLLLDSPQASDPHLQALLDDLELVLAQIVRLPRRVAAPDVYLIDQTVDQREVLPRLREMLAENPTSQP